MSRLRRIFADERGIALVAALGIMVALSMTTVSIVAFASSNERHAHAGEAEHRARALAEAGVNNALTVLGHDDNNALDPALLTPTGGHTCPDGTSCHRQDYEDGYVLWRGEYNNDVSAPAWTITSWGYTADPTQLGAAAGDLVERLQARIGVVPNAAQPPNATAWNFVIAFKSSNATTCDVEVNNGAAVDAPFYIGGNLCLRNGSSIVQTDASRPVHLVVKGKVEVEQGTQQNKSKIGVSSTQPIDQAEIVGGCTTNIANAAHTCNPSSPTLDRVWADPLMSTSPTTITRPTADFAYWYQNANPGPMHGCNPSPDHPTFATLSNSTLDNDTVLDLNTNGSAGTVDLTPVSSYACVGYDGNGFKVGWIIWDAVTRTLTLAGALYIDGSVTIDDNVVIKYDGHATLYLTGVFTMTNGQTRLCAAADGSNCDWDTPELGGWDTGEDMLIVVAHGNDGSGNSASFTQGVQFQGGIFAEKKINLGQSVRIEGPMMGETVEIGQSVQIRPLPLIEQLPFGAPGNPNTHATPQKPIYLR